MPPDTTNDRPESEALPADTLRHIRQKTGDKVPRSPAVGRRDVRTLTMPAVPFRLELSPTDLLELGGSDLAPLLSPAARARILRGISELPLPTRTLCFECRLDDDERVDLALCLATHTAGLEAALTALRGSYAEDLEWQRCLRLLLSWARSENAALAGVPFLYTAFDLGSEAAQLPVPCLSLCADPSFFMRRVGLPIPRAPRESLIGLVDACRNCLDADWITAELCARVRGCLDAVEDLEVRQLSLMLARRPATLKLDITLPAADLPHFLVATGWRGGAAELASQLQKLAPWQRRVQLNYVVGAVPETAPLEIELCCTGSDEPTVEERGRLLEGLMTSGLVSVGKGRALGNLLKNPSIDHNGQWVGRNWYLKLRFEAGRFRSAKAYIGLMQRSAGVALPTSAQSAHDR